MRRKYFLLGVDLFWVAISPFVALYIRDNFAPRNEALLAGVEYAGVAVLVALVVLPLAGVNRTLWRYTSLPDMVRLIVVVTAIVLLTLFSSFALRRLEDIARSLPVIQWFVLFAGMTGSRIATRIWRDRPRYSASQFVGAGEIQNVLIVGVNSIAELYLRTVAEFAPRTISVVGLLASGVELPGRLLRLHEVLGPPEDLQRVVRELEIHGAPVARVIVVEPAKRLSSDALEALGALERSSAISVDWMPELLGFGPRESQKDSSKSTPPKIAESHLTGPKTAGTPINKYVPLKRVLDLLAVAILIVILAPVIVVIATLTAIDVGFPIVFWQKRPGRNGYPFKLYKFRTMHGAHDGQGRRIPEQERSSKFGIWLRRSRLDELPQLYNVLVGDMSFVGPRPLLSCDQPDDRASRLSVRPGLSGFAQVYGNRTMSPTDKNTLDVWYIYNASLWLDIKIMLRTVTFLIRGEHLDLKALQEAREGLERLSKQDRLAGSCRAG